MGNRPNRKLPSDGIFNPFSTRPVQGLCTVAVACLLATMHSAAAQAPDRTVLPIAPPPFQGTIGTTL